MLATLAQAFHEPVRQRQGTSQATPQTSDFLTAYSHSLHTSLASPENKGLGTFSGVFRFGTRCALTLLETQNPNPTLFLPPPLSCHPGPRAERNAALSPSRRFSLFPLHSSHPEESPNTAPEPARGFLESSPLCTNRAFPCVKPNQLSRQERRPDPGRQGTPQSSSTLAADDPPDMFGLWCISRQEKRRSVAFLNGGPEEAPRAKEPTTREGHPRTEARRRTPSRGVS